MRVVTPATGGRTSLRLSTCSTGIDGVRLRRGDATPPLVVGTSSGCVVSTASGACPGRHGDVLAVSGPALVIAPLRRRDPSLALAAGLIRSATLTEGSGGLHPGGATPVVGISIATRCTVRNGRHKVGVAVVTLAEGAPPFIARVPLSVADV